VVIQDEGNENLEKNNMAVKGKTCGAIFSIQPAIPIRNHGFSNPTNFVGDCMYFVENFGFEHKWGFFLKKLRFEKYLHFNFLK
jgi:hypothetical protein